MSGVGQEREEKTEIEDGLGWEDRGQRVLEIEKKKVEKVRDRQEKRSGEECRWEKHEQRWVEMGGERVKRGVQMGGEGVEKGRDGGEGVERVQERRVRVEMKQGGEGQR